MDGGFFLVPPDMFVYRVLQVVRIHAFGGQVPRMLMSQRVPAIEGRGFDGVAQIPHEHGEEGMFRGADFVVVAHRGSVVGVSGVEAGARAARPDWMACTMR